MSSGEANGIATAATAIWGESPPAWFINELSRNVALTRAAWKGGESLPNRRIQNQRLEKAENAAKQLRSFFSDTTQPWNENFITHAKAEFFATEEFEKLLADFIERAVAAAADLRSQSGPDPAWPMRQGTRSGPRPIRGKLLCALTVIEAWREARGRYPAPGNEGAQDACAAVWRAVLPDSDSDADWKPHLQSALAVPRSGGSEGGVLGSLRGSIRSGFAARRMASGLVQMIPPI